MAKVHICVHEGETLGVVGRVRKELLGWCRSSSSTGAGEELCRSATSKSRKLECDNLHFIGHESTVAQWTRSGGALAHGRRSGLKYERWTDNAFEKAMNAVTDDGMKLRAATRAFKIPATSLQDHLYGTITSRQRGNRLTLKPNEEQKLVDCVFKMQDLGHPLTPAELCLKVVLATQTR